MTAPIYVPIATWYKPEHAAAGDRKCFCRKPAVGRTCYWNGVQVSYRYQCGHHMPREAAQFEDGVPL